jgi:hypothetical protein
MPDVDITPRTLMNFLQHRTASAALPTRIAIIAVTVATLLPVLSASAQSLAQQTRRLSAPGDGPTRVISVNPFLPLFGYFSGEFEQRIAPNVSVAVGASHTKFDDTKRSNVDLKARLYPTERGLQGLGVAASLGYAHIKDDTEVFCAPTDIVDPLCASTNKAFNTGSFAIEASYQWLLGPSRKTAITVGGGAKRYFGSDSNYENSTSSIERVVPTLRLSIGYAF